MARHEPVEWPAMSLSNGEVNPPVFVTSQRRWRVDRPFDKLMAGHSGSSWHAGQPKATAHEFIPGISEIIHYRVPGSAASLGLPPPLTPPPPESSQNAIALVFVLSAGCASATYTVNSRYLAAIDPPNLGIRLPRVVNAELG